MPLDLVRVLDRTAPAGTWRATLWGLIRDGRWLQFAALRDGDADALEDVRRASGIAPSNHISREIGWAYARLRS